MKSIEVSGKSVEEAVKIGLSQLGCEAGDVTMDVLEMGSKGLFGMFGKLARVRLTLKENDLDLEMPTLSIRPEREEKPAPKRAEPQPAAPRPAAQEKPAPRPQPSRPAEAESAPQREAAQREVPQPAKHTYPPLVLEDLSAEGKAAYAYLSEVTKLMGVEVEIRMKQDEGRLNIAMTGDSLGVLIGRRGETLDALQYLVSLEVNKGRQEYMRVTLDSENYRMRREEALVKLAARMAQRAKKTGRRVVLEPMNPYERRILHSALQGDAQIATHSEGEEPNRRVVITLKD